MVTMSEKPLDVETSSTSKQNNNNAIEREKTF